MREKLLGWNQRKLGDIATIVRGASPRPKGDPRYYGGDIPRLMIADITRDGKYVTPSIDFLTEEGSQKSRKMNKGDLVISISGTVALPAFLNVDACIHDGFMGFCNINSQIDKNFLYYQIINMRGSLIREATDGGIYVNLTTEIVKRFKITVPPLIEQKKIAQIISEWDSAIEKQEQLIEKKKKFKKGLMQKLLSGEARFKEFSGKWTKVHISDIANQVSDINKENINYTVLSCTKYDGLVESLKYFGKQMFSDDISKYKLVKKNEFAYATNHIEEGSIGLQKICDIGLVSPMYTVFKTDDKMVDNNFIFYLFKTDKYISIYKSRMSASVDRRGSLRWPEFSRIKLNLPTLEEQKRIVEILSNADKEIELLEKELEALKLQKKGLMQRLLIGEVRVKI